MSMSSLRVPAVVATKWLAEKAVEASVNKLRILDGSWHMPFTKRNPRQEFYMKHIPEAQFFEIDDCCDKSSDLDHMLPSDKEFEAYVGRLGIDNDTHVVVYDNNPGFGLFSAQRVWWTFRVFGHDKVSMLDGGLPKWEKDGYNTIDEVVAVYPRSFKANFRADLVKNYGNVVKNIEEKSFTLVDARPAGRFEGTAPEPRAGIKPGHVPGSLNIPFSMMLDSETKTMKSTEELKTLFKEKGADMDQPWTVSCGSGISACLIALGAHLCGKEDVSIYDGAWTDWYQKAKREHVITSK